VANSRAGDVILLWPGTYTETNVSIDKQLTFAAAIPRTVKWTGVDTLFAFTSGASGTEFVGLDLISTDATNALCDVWTNSVPFEMYDCLVRTAKIRLPYDTTYFEDNRFVITSYDGMEFYGDSTGISAGTMDQTTSGYHHFVGCNWSYPDSIGQHFGIRTYAGYVRLDNCQMYGSQVDSSGATIHHTSWTTTTQATACTLEVNNCYIENSGNVAYVSSNMAHGILRNSTFVADTTVAGAVTVKDCTTVNIQSCQLINNVAANPRSLSLMTGRTTANNYISNIVCKGNVIIDSMSTGRTIVSAPVGYSYFSDLPKFIGSYDSIKTGDGDPTSRGFLENAGSFDAYIPDPENFPGDSVEIFTNRTGLNLIIREIAVHSDSLNVECLLTEAGTNQLRENVIDEIITSTGTERRYAHIITTGFDHDTINPDKSIWWVNDLDGSRVPADRIQITVEFK